MNTESPPPRTARAWRRGALTARAAARVSSTPPPLPHPASLVSLSLLLLSTTLANATQPAISSTPDPAPAFVGVLTFKQETLLALQPTSATPAVWHRLGEHVGAYQIVNYDPASARVTLRSPTSSHTLSLREAHVVPVLTAPPPALDTPEGQRLLRAAFQSLFDTGQTFATVADPEARTLTLALQPDGTARLLDAAGRPLTDAFPLPLHILAPAHLPLEEIARRLRQPVAHLATLNPTFEPHPNPATRHTIRIR